MQGKCEACMRRSKKIRKKGALGVRWGPQRFKRDLERKVQTSHICYKHELRV